MKIGIVGLGLIGASLAYDLKQQNHYLIGVSRKQKTCEKALDLNIVDQANLDLKILADTELIFICTPIGAIIPTLESAIPHLNPNTIITDVGSVKGAIVNSASQLWTNFVGSHPMAGTAEQGISAFKPNLFQGASCVITPVGNTPKIAIETVINIWQSVDSKIIITEAQIHDQAVALISHLPVIISANLINSCAQFVDKSVVELAEKIASTGFKDTSRVGGGNPELGVMMAQYNQEYLLSALEIYQKNLAQIINNIKENNWDALSSLLTSTTEQRNNFID